MKSRAGFEESNTPPIRWRKDKLIGCGAYGRVYRAFNLDSGGFIAVKQVFISMNDASAEKLQGANILVDDEGCIKLADFGASKQVAELASISGAKSMKGTPYWMAPEIIRQTGHSFSADIWSVGCTVIEMATGKPPWSQEYKEVTHFFYYIGKTKSHPDPPIPEHLSLEAKDFLLKCLQGEPSLRPSASELLQHPFVTGECKDLYTNEHSAHKLPSSGSELKNLTVYQEKLPSVLPIRETSGNEDIRQVGDSFAVGGSVGSAFALMFDSFKSFNPMSEPIDDSSCEFDGIPEQRERELEDSGELVNGTTCSFGASGKVDNDFTFRHEPPVSVYDVEINVPLDEKAGSNIVSDNGYTSSPLTDLERKSPLQWEGRKQHKNGQINRFLPPSTMVAGEDCISVRPQQKGGRLVLKMVKVPCFQAERSDGHLKLQFSNLRVARRQ